MNDKQIHGLDIDGLISVGVATVDCFHFDDSSDFGFEGSYDIYGVDNEFDLIEALYARWSETNPHLLDVKDFADRRILCAMNPEYTEKCLASLAFADVKSEILRRLGD